MKKLVAKSLFASDKDRAVKPETRDGRVYLHLTRCKYIGVGETLEDAIMDANMRTFSTGWRVEEV